ncbi:hypothetical protein RB597_010161 [Gaeumannomyces tritici]
MDYITLTIHWSFSGLALLIIFARLLWRRLARQRYKAGDYLSIAAAVCVLARMATIHVVLIWGTADASGAPHKGQVLDADEVRRREIGGQLVLANRVIFNSFLWLQKLVLLDFYRRLIKNLWYERMCTWTYLAVLLATYASVQATTLSECRPLRLYWQTAAAVPDGPGGSSECARGPVQLFVAAVNDAATNAMLLALPLPVVLSSSTSTTMRTSWRRRARLAALFALGVFATLVPLVYLLPPPLLAATVAWTSAELLAAAVVVNAPTLWSLWGGGGGSARRGDEDTGSLGKNDDGSGGGGSATMDGSGKTDWAMKRGSVGRFFYDRDAGAELADLGGGGGGGTTESRELVLGGVGNTSTVGRGPDRNEDEERELECYGPAVDGGALWRQLSTKSGITRTMEVIVTTTKVDQSMLVRSSNHDIAER